MEAAFINHMKAIYGAAQQTLATARIQAIKNHYPYFIFVTSTPNGTDNEGEWFHRRWNGSVDSDELFEIDQANGLERWRTDIDVAERVNDPGRNTFIRVKYHWSEDYRKSEEWYRQQCQELDDQRLVNQELDLLFVGGSNCIFDDDTLASWVAHKSVSQLECPHFTKLEIFEEKINPQDYYIIGCDTAASLTGAYCAIQIYSFKDFNQIAEIQVRLGSYTHFGEIIDHVFQWLYRQVGERIILAIENNTIGRAPIEHLIHHCPDFNYHPFLFRDFKKESIQLKDEYGIATTGASKLLMS